MKPQSAKSKGRKFQQYVRDLILQYLPSLTADDVRSTSMGAGGEDILLSSAARKLFPFSVECKNVEKLSIWAAIDQAEENKEQHTPMICFTKNRRDPYVALPLSEFMKLVYGRQDDKQ